MSTQHAVIGVAFLGKNRSSKKSDKHISIVVIQKQKLIRYNKSNKNHYENDGSFVIPIYQIESKNIKNIRIKLHKIIDDLCDGAEKYSTI
jgi:hypothetical protein